jgi:hypothetical protein
MTTGGIVDSDTVREKSAVTVFSELIEEALLDTILLASVDEFLCDLALEIGVCAEFIIPTGTPLCVGFEPVCACVKFSELILGSLLIDKKSGCNSLFFKGTETFGMPVLEGVKSPRFSTLRADESLRTSLEYFEICSVQTAEILCISSLHTAELS